MSELLTAPPLAILPPFVLPDHRGVLMNTARLRGRRNLVLFFLPTLHADAVMYLGNFSARHAEWSWLHTDVLIVVPEAMPTDEVTKVEGLQILRDNDTVRSTLLPDIAPDIAALFVADTDGRVTEWRTARRVGTLPDADTVLAWAWDAARPRGACDGGVAWARPVALATAPSVPIGRFIIGARRDKGSRYHKKR